MPEAVLYLGHRRKGIGPAGTGRDPMFDKFDHIALRATESGFKVGDTLPNSYRWEDGECLEDEQLNGASGLAIKSEDHINAVIAEFRKTYAWGDRVVYVIGGDYASHGEDLGEIIIRKAKVLKVLG